MSILDALFTWSLQFDVPLWFVALLALGLAITIAWEVNVRLNNRRRRLSVNRNARHHIASSILR